MDRVKLKALLGEIGISAGRYSDFKDSGANIQFLCPFHNERRPSAGIHVDNEFGRCFGCGETFNLPKLVAHCMEMVNSFKDKEGITHTSYDYSQANNWLEEKFNVTKKEIHKENMTIRRIEDDYYEEDEPPSMGRYETSRLKLAPLRSGKETHEYYFNRGFTKESAKKFMIGWDSVRMRVTMPVFWGDHTLCGIIGRAVMNEKRPDGSDNPSYYDIYNGGNQPRYYIYDGFPIGDTLYPLPFFKAEERTACLVEGQMDAQWLHQMGFTNVLSSITSKLSKNKFSGEYKQIELLHDLGVKKVLLLRDNDKAGLIGNEHDYKLLKKDFTVYGTDYPEGKVDPQQLTKKDYIKMLYNMYDYGTKGMKARRID